MADFHNYCNWYTVWDAKTGDLIETFVDSLIPDLTDEQLQQAADGFANSVKSAVIARYKMKPSERKEEFTGKEAAFLSKLFNL